MKKKIVIFSSLLMFLLVLICFVFTSKHTPTELVSSHSSELVKYIVEIKSEDLSEKEIEKKKQFLLSFAKKHDAEIRQLELENFDAYVLTITRDLAEKLTKQGYHVVETKPNKIYLW